MLRLDELYGINSDKDCQIGIFFGNMGFSDKENSRNCCALNYTCQEKYYENPCYHLFSTWDLNVPTRRHLWISMRGGEKEVDLSSM